MILSAVGQQNVIIVKQEIFQQVKIGTNQRVLGCHSFFPLIKMLRRARFSISRCSSTFGNQSLVPKLPIPSIENLKSKYLKSLNPVIINKKQLLASNQIVENFFKEKGKFSFAFCYLYSIPSSAACLHLLLDLKYCKIPVRGYCLYPL